MGFEKYDKGTGRGRGTSEPRISLRKSETIGINGPAIEEYFDEAGGIVLYYDEEDNRVGFEPRGDDDTDAYTIVMNTQGDSATLNASGFMTDTGLVPEQTTHYAAQWDDDAELVFIDLDEPVKTYGSAEDEAEG